MLNFFNNSYNNDNKFKTSENKEPTNRGNSNMTMDFDTLQKARQDLVGEIQAIIEYDNHIHTTNNSYAKTTWEGIKNEELARVGELLGLINYLDPNQKQYVEKGFREFEEILKKM